MSRSHILHVFKKDGLELLRDRRTLFVNILLPVLLYPLMLLFLVQVMQLTRAQQPPPPGIVLVGVDDPDLRALITDPPAEARDGAGYRPDPGADAPPPTPPTRRPTIIDPPQEVQAELRRQGEALLGPWQRIRDLEERWRRTAAARDGEAGRERLRDELEAARAAFEAARAPLLARLRAPDLAAVYVVIDATPPGSQRRLLIAAKDDAHTEHDEAQAMLGRAFVAWRRGLQERAVVEAGLDPALLDPVSTRAIELAPAAQATRTRLAAIIPLLLVLMAVSGAFYPALDLLAGERERGTLESLLAWPARRKDIFIGKLLVTIAAAGLSVVLNIASIGLTTGIAGSQLAASMGGAETGGLLTVGLSVLALSFLALLPLVVTLSAVSLALAGLAASAKEAQNYLTPLFLVVLAAAGVAMVPGARPNLALDLVPITGPVLALKESLRATNVPWLHLALSTATSIALAAVVVSWSVRLLDSERFCYPGLVRAGWGRFRKWGPRPLAPGALEVLGVFAVCVAGFLGSAAFLQGQPPAVMVGAPLVLCILLPALIHRWAGDYPAATTLGVAWPDRGSLARAGLAIPLAMAASVCIGTLQPRLPAVEGQAEQMEQIFAGIRAAGGLPLLLFCAAVLPAVCEEALCRGTLLAGMRHSLGRRGGIAVSSFLFAILHLSPERFLPQFVIGIVLGVLTVRSGSLLPAILLHFGHNAGLILIATWTGSGGEEGGPLGAGASAAYSGVLAIALAGLWWCLGGTTRWKGPTPRD